jgi:hypothetical protein
MRADPAVAGEGLATAGVILGWIGVALSVIELLSSFSPRLSS